MAIFNSKSGRPPCAPETQVAALQKLDRIPAAFEVWCYGRREDAEGPGGGDEELHAGAAAGAAPAAAAVCFWAIWMMQKTWTTWSGLKI